MRQWLRLFRAQTAPATILLLLTPYLANASLVDVKTLVFGLLFVMAHFFSFGHNSLMDAAMLYDRRDPSKRHHPLISGQISLHRAHNVIHWGLALIILLMAAATLLWSPNVGVAMFFLMGWVVFGHAYNDGLSKESLFGFLAISICMTSLGAWGWFLSHRGLNPVGLLYLAYVFFTILYQIAWSGFLKEMALQEKSNVLTKMGAALDVTWKGEKVFLPGKARFFAWLVKGINLLFGFLLWWLTESLVMLVWVVIILTSISFICYKTTKPRVFNRGKELFYMSLMEILTIYLPVPLMLGLLEASVLMTFGVVYFFLINLVLWGKLYPRV